MNLVETESLLNQEDVSAEQKISALRLLAARFGSIRREEAMKRIGTMPHITFMRYDKDAGLFLLSYDQGDHQLIFGFHGEDVVALGSIPNKGVHSRQQLFDVNHNAIAKAADAFVEYKKQHPLPERGEEQEAELREPSEGAKLAERFGRRGEGNRRGGKGG